MKTIILILLSFTAYCQSPPKIEVGKCSYIIKIKSDEKLSDAFRLLKKVRSREAWWYDLYVIKDGKTYYKPGIQLLSKRTYRIVKI